MSLTRKYKCNLFCILVIFMIMVPAIVLAIDAPTPDVIERNPKLFEWILWLTLAGNGLLVLRVFKSQDKLWERGDDHADRISFLEGVSGRRRGDKNNG